MPPNGSVLELLKQNDSFSLFLELLDEADLLINLEIDTGITVFAPTNEAISAIGEAEINRMKSHKNLLKRVLSLHILSGKLCF